MRFQDIIDAAFKKTGRQVVILIDEYDKPFANDPCKIFKIGVSFSTENRRIEDWKIVE